jgi:hypothetical protein
MSCPESRAMMRLGRMMVWTRISKDWPPSFRAAIIVLALFEACLALNPNVFTRVN